MSYEVISYLLNNKSLKKRLQFQLVLQCAPFLKGLRAACIISVGNDLCSELPDILKDTDICYTILNQTGERCLVLFYREAAFTAYMNQVEIREFLHQYGYEDFPIARALNHLKRRIALFFGNNESFPHEMGVVLGYPIADVEGFIAYGGRNYLFSGYWKVYDNLWQAKRIFGMYDRAKVCAVNEFVAGKPVKEIACV